MSAIDMEEPEEVDEPEEPEDPECVCGDMSGPALGSGRSARYSLQRLLMSFWMLRDNT